MDEQEVKDAVYWKNDLDVGSVVARLSPKLQEGSIAWKYMKFIYEIHSNDVTPEKILKLDPVPNFVVCPEGDVLKKRTFFSFFFFLVQSVFKYCLFKNIALRYEYIKYADSSWKM